MPQMGGGVCVCASLGMRGEEGPAVETERREGAPGYEGGGGFLGMPTLLT
jgi:hypothetical protein